MFDKSTRSKQVCQLLLSLIVAVVKITCIHSTKRELKERCLVRDQIALVVETGAKIIYNWDEIDQVSLTIRKLKA